MRVKAETEAGKPGPQPGGVAARNRTQAEQQLNPPPAEEPKNE